MTPEQEFATNLVAYEVVKERHRQDEKFGMQSLPNVHPEGLEAVYRSHAQIQRDRWQRDNAERVEQGYAAWDGVLLEEVWEALAETDDPVKLREELIQVAAVAVAWVEHIDRRKEAVERVEFRAAS